jgi:hypothetical protein
MDGNHAVIAFGVALLRKEIPSVSEVTESQARRWLSSLIEGRLSYPETRDLAKAHCGSCHFVDRMQQIISISPDPLPEPDMPTGLPNHNSARKKTRQWTTDEDNRLLAGIRKYGTEGSWSAIAGFVGHGRKRSQCSQRWCRVLDPRIDKATWTAADDQRLLELVDAYGLKSWVHISSLKGDRSDVQCRYRYTQLEMQKKSRATDKVRSEMSFRQAQPPSPVLHPPLGIDRGRVVPAPIHSEPPQEHLQLESENTLDVDFWVWRSD